MEATQSPPPTSTSSSLASRRQARPPVLPFILPPRRPLPRGPPTPASAPGTAPRQVSASPEHAPGGSPGYSTGTAMLAHPHRAASHSPYQGHRLRPMIGATIRRPRLAPRPGPLTHPHDPKVADVAAGITTKPATSPGDVTAKPDATVKPSAIANAEAPKDAGTGASSSTSPSSPPARRPLPNSPGAIPKSSPPRPTERLPPISSLISPMERAGLDYLTSQISQPSAVSNPSPHS